MPHKVRLGEADQWLEAKTRIGNEVDTVRYQREIPTNTTDRQKRTLRRFISPSSPQVLT
jgi:hypothetical protein